MKKSAPLAVAALTAMASAAPVSPAPSRHSYAIPNGWAPQPGGTKPNKASKTAKNRARAKAAAKSRRAQRSR